MWVACENTCGKWLNVWKAGAQLHVMQLKFFFIGVWRVYFCVLTWFGYQSQRGAFHSSCLIWPDIEMPWDAIALHTFVMNDINIRFFFSSFSLILFWNLNVPFLQTIISTMSRLCVWAMLCCAVMWCAEREESHRLIGCERPINQATRLLKHTTFYWHTVNRRLGWIFR